MTREEAIKVLKEYLALDEDIDNEYLEAQKVAIKSLEEQQNPNSIRINFVGEKEAEEFNEYLKNQQEPCDDCISRKEMLKYQEYLHGKMSNEENHKLWEFIKGLPSVTPQEPNTWSLDDAREDFMSDVYNTLDFLPTNDEANQIIDSFDSVTSGIRQESILDKKRDEILEEKECDYDDFER